MSALVVRAASPLDDEPVGELLVAAFTETYRKKMPEVVVTERRRAELRDVAGKRAVAKVWVAERDGRVVGTVAVWPPGAPGSEAFVEGAADLRHLAIAPSEKGLGTSHALLDAAEAHVRALGCQHLCLHVRRGAVGVANLYVGRDFKRYPSGDIDHLPEVFLEAYVKNI